MFPNTIVRAGTKRDQLLKLNEVGESEELQAAVPSPEVTTKATKIAIVMK